MMLSAPYATHQRIFSPQLAREISCVKEAQEGFIRQGRQALREFNRRLPEFRNNDITELYKARLISVAEKAQSSLGQTKEASRIASFLDTLRNDYKIYGFPAAEVILGKGNFVLDWNNSAENELFLATDLLEWLAESYPPEVCEEYLLHTLLCAPLGHAQALALQQRIYPAHYQNEERVLARDKIAKGELGKALFAFIDQQAEAYVVRKALQASWGKVAREVPAAEKTRFNRLAQRLSRIVQPVAEKFSQTKFTCRLERNAVYNTIVNHLTEVISDYLREGWRECRADSKEETYLRQQVQAKILLMEHLGTKHAFEQVLAQGLTRGRYSPSYVYRDEWHTEFVALTEYVEELASLGYAEEAIQVVRDQVEVCLKRLAGGILIYVRRQMPSYQEWDVVQGCLDELSGIVFFTLHHAQEKTPAACQLAFADFSEASVQKHAEISRRAADTQAEKPAHTYAPARRAGVCS